MSLNWCNDDKLTDEKLSQKLRNLRASYSVNELDISSTNVTFIPKLVGFPNFEQLQVLNISYTTITELRDAFLPLKIQTIVASNCEIQNVLLGKCIFIEELYLQGNRIAVLEEDSIPRNVKTLNLSNNHLKNVSKKNIPKKIEILDLDNNKLSSVNLKDNVTIRDLTLKRNNLTYLDNTNVPSSTQVLKASDNEIVEISLCHCEDLYALTLNNNKLESLTSGCLPKAVQVINADDNNISFVYLRECYQLQELKLAFNKISELQNHWCPPSIKELSFHRNTIEELRKECIPSMLRRLCASHNKIKRFCLSHCKELKEVDLKNNSVSVLCDDLLPDSLTSLDINENNLSYLNGRYLPADLEVIHARDNKITLVSFEGRCKNIKDVNLANNNINKLCSLPGTITRILLYGNPINVFEEECFPNQTVLKALHRSLDRVGISFLQQPPPEVFKKKEVTYIWQYFQNELLPSSRNRMVVLGESEAGKTSLVKTLISGKSFLTAKADRTQVVDVKTFYISEHDSFQIFDQGGHYIYTITHPLFITTNCNAFIAHDASNRSEDYMKQTRACFQRVLQQNPKCVVHFLLTQIDKVGLKDVKDILSKLKQNIVDFLDIEIQSFALMLVDLKDRQKEKEEDAMSTSKNVRRGHEKETDAAEVKACLAFDEVLEIENLKSDYERHKKRLQIFPLSSASYSGIEPVRELLVDTARQNKRMIPEEWGRCYNEIRKIGQSQQFLKIDQVRQFSSFSSEENLRACLEYFHDVGLLFWFGEYKELESYIFHDIEFLVKILKSVFNHDLKVEICLESNESLRGKFTEEECEHAVSMYQNEGLLSFRLLSCLWDCYDLSKKDKMSLIMLMKAFDLCHEIAEVKMGRKDDVFYFFPWFVQKKQNPQEIKTASPLVVTNRKFSLQFNCEFFNKVPNNLQENLCVRLQRYAVNRHYGGTRKAWKDGLLVTLNRVQLMAFRNRTKESMITCCTRGLIEDIEEIWNQFNFLYEVIQELLEKFHGLIKSFHVVCSHCGMRKKIRAHKWHPALVWRKDMKDSTHLECCGEINIPAAVIMDVTFTRDPEKNYNAAKKYLTGEATGVSFEDQVPNDIKSHIYDNLALFSSVMHTRPVIDHLFAEGVVSYSEKHALRPLPPGSQAEKLLTEVVLKGSKSTVLKLKEALEQSCYHTNSELARVVPSGDDIHDVDRDIFLSPQEVGHIKKYFYLKFQSTANVIALIPELMSKELIDPNYFYEDLNAISTTREKAAYLLDNVLLRGTYRTVVGFRNALTMCRQQELAELLPSRTGGRAYMCI